MLHTYVRFVFCTLVAFEVGCNVFCESQFIRFRDKYASTTPLPFPACRADNIDCLRRGLRTFFFLMDSEHVGMKPIDPISINSVAVTLPEQQLSFLMRRLNVTGARWTKLVNRKFNLMDSKNEVIFSSDLHVTGEINVNMPGRSEPYVAFITMDIQNVESNITYAWAGRRGIDNEYYILIDGERIAVRNTRTPTFFLQPNIEDSLMIENTLQTRTDILDHLSNEIVDALMHTVIDNFRLFASRVPVRYYYKYNQIQ